MGTTDIDHRQRVLKVLLHIQSHLDDELGLEELASIACYSPFHFHRVFRGMVGESLKAHIRRIRLERAAMRLLFTDWPVLRVAQEAGYDSNAAFSRAFNAQLGLAPSQLRATHSSSRSGISPDAAHHQADGAAERGSTVHYSPDGNLGELRLCSYKGEPMDVKIEHIEPFRVAFMRHVGPYDTCGSTWERFCSVLGPRGLISGQSVFLGICHDDPELTPSDKVRYDACMRVDEGFQPPEEIAIQEVDGGDYAVVTHRGPFDKLAETYAFVYGQWLPQSKRDLRAAPGFEVYLNDPGSTPPEELLIELHIPLEPSSP